MASVNYGTNGGTALSRSATIPARTNAALVSSSEFNASGDQIRTTDPAGTVTALEYDQAGRRTKVIENWVTSSSSSSAGSGCGPSVDVNRETRFTYNSDSQLATLTAVNAITGNQVTTYTYGVTTTGSALVSNLLLNKVAYPDSSSSTDVVEYQYNRQGEATTIKDQLGTVHTLDRDGLGRLIHDRVTTLGTGVDTAVRRITWTYDVRGLILKRTNYSSATVSQNSIVNEVQHGYNDFGQVVITYQSHSGAVNTSTTAKTQYAYADGSANTVRPTEMTYPGGFDLRYSYGTANGTDDVASRIKGYFTPGSSITRWLDYSYLGLGGFVEVDDNTPEVKYTLIGTAGGDDPDTGDIYRGLDRFGRVKDAYWRDYGNNTDKARIQYGYDRVGNRLWRYDVVATGKNEKFDELYAYDRLDRLKTMGRGTLNLAGTALSSTTFGQCWTLDTTGNWQGFRQDNNGSGSWNLIQARTSNPVNEITDITNSAGSAWPDPVYNAVGNMTTLPRPVDLTAGYVAKYDAWNRLVELRQSGNNNLVAKYAYDGRNFRIIQENYKSNGGLDETRHYYYNENWQVLAERLGTTPDSATNERRFIWGQRYIDDLVRRGRDTNGNGELNQVHYVYQDANWNVIAISNDGGNVQERYAYTAYGEVKFLTDGFGNRSSSNYDWETLYAGYRFQSLTGLYHVRFRAYHPGLGVWMQRDPIGYAAGLNLYAYNYSVSTTDSLGLSPVTFTPPTRPNQIVYPSVAPVYLETKSFPQVKPYPVRTPTPGRTPFRMKVPAPRAPGVGGALMFEILIHLIDPPRMGDAEIRKPQPLPVRNPHRKPILQKEKCEETCATKHPGMPICNPVFYLTSSLACKGCNYGADFRPGQSIENANNDWPSLPFAPFVTDGLVNVKHIICDKGTKGSGGNSIFCGDCCVESAGKSPPRKAKRCKCAPSRDIYDGGEDDVFPEDIIFC